MKKKSTLFAGIILIVLCIAAGILYSSAKPKTELGEKEVAVVVVHGDDTKTDYTFHTDAEYLREVLEENGLIEGEDGPYGIFITVVDGEVANSSKQQWWCITKEGERVNTSADEAPVTDGCQYELTLTEGY